MITDDDGQRSRDLIKQMLLDPRREAVTPSGLFLSALHLSQQAGRKFEWGAALAYWGELQRIGVIAILGSGSHGSYAELPEFIVTERGRRMLAEERLSPTDHSRYMRVLVERVPRIDPVAITYIEEAIEAWQAGIYRASAIMTGGACERLILQLAEAVAASSIEPFASQLTSDLGADRPVGIGKVFEKVRFALQSAKASKTVKGDLVDAIDVKLTPIFERARALRNDVGHPTGEAVSEEEAEAGLLLFPSFCEYASRWVETLAGLPPVP